MGRAALPPCREREDALNEGWRASFPAAKVAAVLNATKPKSWRAWLLLAVACWSLFAPAALAARAPDFASCGPKNRIWNFFANYGKNASGESLQVADSHQEKLAHGYELVSGVHVYLYANADGVNNRDPSGNFSLVELAETMMVQGYVRAMAYPRVFGVLSFAISMLIPAEVQIGMPSFGLGGDFTAVESAAARELPLLIGS